jgi:threonine/homoserine/homoserine lactone efflux protein
MLTLAGVILLGAMSPGPDFLIVLRSVVTTGRRAGMACAAGIATGILVWATVTSFGIAGLLAASAVAFTVVKLVGAAYLVLLGVRALLAARRGAYTAPAAPAAPGSPGSPGEEKSAGSAFVSGLLTNLLNPKVAVVFLALWPQFMPANATVLDTMIMAAVAATTTILWFSTLANVVMALRRYLVAAKVRRTIDAVFGTVLVAIGIRIATTQ